MCQPTSRGTIRCLRQRLGLHQDRRQHPGAIKRKVQQPGADTLPAVPWRDQASNLPW